MKDKIIELLSEGDKAKDLICINDSLNLKTSAELEKLQIELRNLVREGIVHETKKGKYILMENCPSLKSGKLSINKNGYAFLLQEGKDIYISKENLKDAIDGDTVLVDTFTKGGKIEGNIIKILSRNLKNVIGEILFVQDKPTLILDDKHLDITVNLINHFSNLVDGHKVLVALNEETGYKTFTGTIIKIIGHKNDPDIDILTIASKHGIELDFSKEALDEVKKIPDTVLDSDKIGRVDLTGEQIFTIDGDDTKDIDDAISIKYHNHIFTLGVHIADVSYYVKPNMHLYAEAYKKGTSSYLADRVLPMLPHELSNGICSLNPNVERLAISCVMEINEVGKTISYDIFPSIIKSKKKMTYKNVNKILIDNIIPPDYAPFSEDIRLMQKLSSILSKKMLANGYINFDIPEVKIIQDENGKCIDIVKREQLAGEKLIENFMIAANETVATHIANMDLPFIYRVHGLPKEEKIEDFINFLKILNKNVNTKGINFSNKRIEGLLNELKDDKDYSILSSMLLKSMQKAVYSPTNIGHFGLGLRNYTHFTSPIRRFPDTIVHELLRCYLFNKDIDNKTINYYENYLKEVALHTSEREQEAVEAEREVNDMKMAEYMESYIGLEFTGIITTVTNFGFFVQLPNLVEGLVHISTLSGYYKYVPEMLALVKDNKVCFQIGNTVKIKVTGASKEARMIDFEVIDGNSK